LKQNRDPRELQELIPHGGLENPTPKV